MERFAQEALGHNSKAVHRAYAKRALMKIPSREDYEQRMALQLASAASGAGSGGGNKSATTGGGFVWPPPFG